MHEILKIDVNYRDTFDYKLNKSQLACFQKKQVFSQNTKSLCTFNKHDYDKIEIQDYDLKKDPGDACDTLICIKCSNFCW